MIRRKVSNGLLRAATQAQPHAQVAAPASISAAHASQHQTANLASSVLLSSQRNWKGETVNTLKSELKKRGLSQTGNKATLVARISSAETSQLLPPMPRSLSTTSAAKKKAAATSQAQGKQDEDATATINKGEKEITTGPEISSKRDEADAFEKPTKEQITAAPGLPESGKVEPSSGERLSVKMPGPPVEEAKEQVIPLEPDNFRSNDKIPQEQSHASDTPGPKVMTVASASTHLSGGPVSAVHESGDSSTMDAQADAEGNLPASFEGAGTALASAVNSFAGMSRTAGEFSRVLLPEIKLPKPSGGKKEEEYKAPKEGLNQDERKGLWVLGGIVGLGLLLGGGSSGASATAKAKAKEAAAKAKNAVKGKGASGPKGDADWEKASGAGVVGHGSRKE